MHKYMHKYIHTQKRVIFAVPFVSIVLEKAEYFRQLFEQEKVRVVAYCSGANNPLPLEQSAGAIELSVCICVCMYVCVCVCV
jgi:hypothetical protein